MVTTRGCKREADAAASAYEGTPDDESLATLAQKKAKSTQPKSSEAKRQRKLPGSAGNKNGNEQQSDGATKADHALAVIASIDAGGEDPQEQLQKPHKQVSLISAFGGGNSDSPHNKQRPARESKAAAASASAGSDKQLQSKGQQQQHQQPLKQTGLRAVAAKNHNSKGNKREAQAVSNSAEDEETKAETTAENQSESHPKHQAKGTKQAKGEAKTKDKATKGSTGGSSAFDSGKDGHAAGGSGDQEADEKLVVLDKSDHHLPKKRDGRKNQQVEAAKESTEQLEQRVVRINRAPTLTLWVKAVAEREGYSEDTAATFGRAISGMLAQAKGRSLGKFQEKDQDTPRTATSESEKASVFGMNIKVAKAGGTMVAMGSDGKPMQPRQAHGYLHRSFGDALEAAQKSLEALAAAYSPEDIGGQAYKLYEKFRPNAGWGQKGNLDLNFIEALAKHVDQ